MDLFDDLPDPVNNGIDATDESLTDDKLCGTRRCKRLSEGNQGVDQDESLTVKRVCNRHCDRIALALKGYVAARKGERDEMQDAHVILDNYNLFVSHTQPTSVNLALYGVFDGHGGLRASTFAAEQLHQNLAQKFPKGDQAQIEGEIKKAFVDAFKKTDEDFLKAATKRKPAWKDGSTALIVVAINDVLYIANLGDSKAVLGRHSNKEGKTVPVLLSRDHNPTQYEERMRIQEKGGHVRDGRVMGILEVSRSIGDGQYKAFGVTCIPDVRRCQLISDDRFVILACDGLWKVFTPEAAVAFVCKTLEENHNQQKDEATTDDDAKYECACSRLASEAVRKGSGDNVTAIIVAINYAKRQNTT